VFNCVPNPVQRVFEEGPDQTSRASIGIGESEIASGKSKWRSQKEVLDGKGGACAPQDIDILHLSFFRSAREEDILESEALALVSYSTWGCYAKKISGLPSWGANPIPLTVNIASTHFFASRWRDPHLAAFHKLNTLSMQPNTRWRLQGFARTVAPKGLWIIGLYASKSKQHLNDLGGAGRRGSIFMWQSLRRQAFYSHSH
jgi:hypothetical protein